MKLCNRDAEHLLLEKVKSLSEHHDSWRCIYINFAAHKNEYSEGLRTHVITTIIKELLEHEEGYIYLCEDSDAFILFQGKASAILDKLGEHFKGLHNAHPTAQPEDELYTIFDLSRHWQIFLSLCKTKAAAILPALFPTVNAGPVVQTKSTLPIFDTTLFSAANAKRHTRKRLVVLIVEDDPFTRRLVASTLKGDYDVIEAGDGAQAIHMYEKSAPDMVFLDIELPDVNGHVLLAKFLAFDPSAFIVMLSANSIKENILAALEKGAQGFIAKPFTKEKLTHYLRMCQTMRQGQALQKQGA